MDPSAAMLEMAHIIARNSTSDSTTSDSSARPATYKAVGICLAVASGLFIGVSFILKKIGLLKANEKYKEAAGDGYGYLKNAYWWTGMTLMIIGEICNFVAYAFVDAILVTPLGALSVVITTIGSAIFLKERLSMVGKIGCFLCIIGSVVIVMNAPEESSAGTIQQMQHWVIEPGFLAYAGVLIVGCAFTAWWAGPRYGKKSMMVYLTVCSNIGGLSVVATQGLGAAIVAQIGGTKQYDQWFLYVLFVFVIATLLTEIIFLNKALNIYNAALVTPTYYVYFTSCTIITSAILFQGFTGTVTSIVTVVMGFFVICAGVVLLQLSKSAKDVPDAAVFSGDLDQVRTIAEQEQPESEPKADAIRGTAGIIRQFSTRRMDMELAEARRLHEESNLTSIGEDEQVEFDGLRRRKTRLGSSSSRGRRTPGTPVPRVPELHPPLGMSHFPDDWDHEDEERPTTANFIRSAIGTVKSRAQTMVPGRTRSQASNNSDMTRDPIHPVALTEINIPGYKLDDHNSTPYTSHNEQIQHVYGLPAGLRDQDTSYDGARPAPQHSQHIHFADGVSERAPSRGTLAPPTPGSLGPTPPPHGNRRQFSFQNIFRRAHHHAADDDDVIPSVKTPPSSPPRRPGHASRLSSHLKLKGTTEEERLGLVKGDTRADEAPVPPYAEVPLEEEADDSVSVHSEDYALEGKARSPVDLDENSGRYGRALSSSPESKRGQWQREKGSIDSTMYDGEPYEDEEERRKYEERKRKFMEKSGNRSGNSTPENPPMPPPKGGSGGAGKGAFI